MTSSTSERRLNLWLLVLFCASLALHLHFATTNWHSRFMAGHEFRQTQTALIAHYIDQEDNFSIDYSVPLLGKPWVLPLEFPLYEWGIVALSRSTGWAQFEAARAISLTSFYLTLPALYLVFGQLGLSRTQRLFALACTLACPVYIFYARAVLVDPMALLFSAWFLAAFTRALREGSWRWALPCALCGTAAGLVKSLVWFVWIVPAALYGVWRLREDWRSGGLRSALRTIGSGVGAVAVPFGVAVWWARHTDAIKSAHPSAYIFTSANLARDNYGTFSLGSRFAAATWRNLLTCWQQSLLPPWALALIVVPGVLLLPRWRVRIVGAGALFLAAQLLIPLAYAYQDYYFYAANAFAAAAVAFVFMGLLETRLPHWLAALLLLAPLAALFGNYHAGYFRLQSVVSDGGSPLTQALRHLLYPEEVIVVSGQDWAPIVPYFSQRRALMIRHGLERDAAYLERAFTDLRDEQVGALLLTGPERTNNLLLDTAERLLGIDPRPILEYGDTTLYLHRDIVAARTADTLRSAGYADLLWHEPPEPRAARQPLAGTDRPVAALTGRDRLLFARMHPRPYRFYAQFEPGRFPRGDNHILTAHPVTRVWFHVPPAATHITVDFGLSEGAYSDPTKSTDGVELRVSRIQPDGSLRPLYSRVLNPRDNPADRGELHADIALLPGADGDLVLETLPGPHDNFSFDWAFLGAVAIE
ncbi:MAG: phospholipid carrier-dependent glycosyltransferase [Opitutaceae bacterium]